MSGKSFETLGPAAEESLGRVVLPDSHAGRADALSAPFVCSWTEGGYDAAWVQVAGELDIAAVPQLEHTLLESQSQSRLVVVDLRGLAFMDSFGARAIAKAAVRARQAGRRLVVLRRRSNVDRMFALAGFSDQVEIGVINSVEPAVGARPELAHGACLMSATVLASTAEIAEIGEVDVVEVPVGALPPLAGEGVAL